MQKTSKLILVTGGAGYIGSHTAIVLLEAKYDVVILDNLCNSNSKVIERIKLISGSNVKFEKVDLTVEEEVLQVFSKYDFDGVIHFAALKAVKESCEIPCKYYHVNVAGTMNLLNAMKKYNVSNLVFSSSATVYGDITRFGEKIESIPEVLPLEAVNPYGRTKIMVETIIKDHSAACNSFNACALRYFNPIGAHPSGMIGENPEGIPNNLLPYIGQVAVGKREYLQIFGDDYDSKDGTPIRDYIHIMDLAEAHLFALKKLQSTQVGYAAWNIGTGKGLTVFEVLNAFESACKKKIPYKIVKRRAGDVLNLTADPSLAVKELQWKAKFDIDDACRDLWRWIETNPEGLS